MTENGVLISRDGTPIYWHLPEGRTSGSLPDSEELWQKFWEHRANVSGFAHTHPGKDQPYPSSEDLTTFSAIEIALGLRLVWWIVSEGNYMIAVTWRGPGKYSYNVCSFLSLDLTSCDWLQHLRKISY